MPHLFRPQYTKVDRETGEKITRRTRKWYGRLRDANGVMRRVPLCTDKVAARTKLLRLMRDTERRLAGWIDPTTDHLTRPIEEHIEQYRTHLVANARSEKHIRETIRLITRVVNECRFHLLADLQGGSDALEQYLARRREEGCAHRTINADLVAVRSFCRWLISKRRIRDDATVGLRRLNVEEDRRRQRRPLTDDESRRLINAAFRSKRRYRNLSGADRSLIYTLAQRTGLRRNELRSLKPGSFDLDSSPPVLHVEAANSKRRRNDLLPLPPDVADTVQNYLVGRPTDEPLWPGSWWNRAAEMLRLDLAEAGIAPEDDQGRIVDFHGQRMTFITALARVGVPPAIAQKLARHSDINLTMGTYTRLQMADLAEAVGKLPALRPGADEDEGLARTTPVPKQAGANGLLVGRVVAAWERLSDVVRQTILALVESAPEENAVDGPQGKREYMRGGGDAVNLPPYSV